MKPVDAIFSLTHLPADLLGRVGEAVASAATRLQTAWPAAAAAPAAELVQLEDLGLQLQAVARMLAAPTGADPEPVDLGVAALQARAEWAGAFRRAGAHWVGPEQGCTVLTNPAVLKQLLDLALGHALGLGTQIVVAVALREAHPQAVLRTTISRPGAELFDARPGDAAEWHWALLCALARHAGVAVERQVQALAVELTLAFEPLGAAITEAQPEPAMLPSTPVPPGCRVLLLEPHEPTRVQAERLMLAAGVAVDSAATVAHARDLLALRTPECLVTGIASDDSALALLVKDLRARQPGLRVVEFTDLPHVFAVSLPAAGTPARVARREFERTLVAALAQELGAPR